jgi:hypothetical protein
VESGRCLGGYGQRRPGEGELICDVNRHPSDMHRYLHIAGLHITYLAGSCGPYYARQPWTELLGPHRFLIAYISIT